MAPRVAGAAALAAAMMLSGCKDEKRAAPPPADSSAERAVKLVEQDLQASAKLPGAARFRGVAVYAQAQPQRRAVCGQVTPFPDDPNIFVPFVSVVTLGGEPGGPPREGFEHFVGTSTTEASRVYAAIVANCYDGGGTSATPLRSAAPTPPLPDGVPDPAASASAPSGKGAQPVPPKATQGFSGAPASGSVTVRQSANVHTDPHGPSVRVAPRGTELRVFAQAPGGWYQVGDTAPWGWMHESMLDRH